MSRDAFATPTPSPAARIDGEVVGGVAHAHGVGHVDAEQPRQMGEAGPLVHPVGHELRIAPGRVRDVGGRGVELRAQGLPQALHGREVGVHEDDLAELLVPGCGEGAGVVGELLDALEPGDVGALGVVQELREDAPARRVQVQADAVPHGVPVEPGHRLAVHRRAQQRLGVAVAVDEPAVVRDHVAAAQQRGVDARQAPHDGGVRPAGAGDEQDAERAHALEGGDVGRGHGVAGAQERLVHVACDEPVHRPLPHLVVAGLPPAPCRRGRRPPRLVAAGR